MYFDRATLQDVDVSSTHTLVRQTPSQGSADRGQLVAVGGPAQLQVRVVVPKDAGSRVVDAWCELESRAVAPNPFATADFVLPALEFLTPGAQIFFALVEDSDGRLRGFGVFEQSGPVPNFPLRHIAAYSCLHSYLGGFLVDRECPEQVVDAFLRFFVSAKADWYGVRFAQRPSGSEFAAMREGKASRAGLVWHTFETVERAILHPSDAGESYLQTKLHRRNKDCRRLMRQLSAVGKVEWRFLRGEEVTHASVARFLDLENDGWKRQQGTSLLSRPAEKRFFEEMIARFRRRGRVFFTELCLNGEIIASTANLICGNEGFAFKIGWDARYAHFAPGILNEVEFIRHAPQVCPDLACIDSGALPGTFIESLWTDRRTLATGIYTFSPLGEKAVAAAKMIKRLTR
jgi:CelD/BcsL family acetyltransferase involved in cellulose biosynthesis